MSPLHLDYKSARVLTTFFIATSAGRMSGVITCAMRSAAAWISRIGGPRGGRTWPALPAGLPNLRFRLRLLFRWVLHRLHLFAGSGSGVLLIYDHRRVVHYSGFTPKYWRFPFVADDDFQIGDTWTEPAYRKKGSRPSRYRGSLRC